MSEKCECNAVIIPGDKFCYKCRRPIKQSDGGGSSENNELRAINHVEKDSSGEGDSEKINEDISSSEHQEKIFQTKNPFSTPEPELNGFVSDCKHFLVEWNQAASAFIKGASSSFQFRLTPLTDEAANATGFLFNIKLPGAAYFKEYDPRIMHLRSSRVVRFHIDTCDLNIGVSQNVDIHFSYQLDGKEYCFDQQLLIDIYPDGIRSTKILENLHISIGDISQSGDVSDHKLSVLEGLHNLTSSKGETLKELKKLELWVPLDMYAGYPISQSEKLQSKALKKVTRPHKKLILECNNGLIIYLFSEDVVVGKSRECDIVMRHGHVGDNGWCRDMLQRMNRKLSSFHFKSGIDDRGAWVADDESTNGTYLDGKQIDTDKHYLTKPQNHQLSMLAPTTSPFNINITLKVFFCTDEVSGRINDHSAAGLLIKYKTHDSIVNLLVKENIPLASLLPGAGDFSISYQDNNFLLTNGSENFWLDPDNANVPENCGILKITAP